MHICLVGIEYPFDTSFGGIATYQYLLAHELIKLGMKVTVICGTNKKDYDYYEDGIHVIRIHTDRKEETIDTYNKYREKVKKIILNINGKSKIDIIESPEFSGEIVEYQKERTIPIVIKLHTSYLMWSDLNNTRLYEELHNKIVDTENVVLKNADKVICCSSLLKSIMPKYHTISKDKIEVIPNPADLINFYPEKNNHNSNKIIYCGALEERKGIYILARAIPLVLDEIPEAIFEFVGHNSKIEKNGLTVKENLLSLIPSKYHSNLEFVGGVANKELNKYYNEARIGVIPSLFDNFPYVALEELATELPIIASDNTGIVEMIEHNKSGMLYNPSDHIALAKNIIDLFLDDKKRRELGKNGRNEVLKKYTPKIVCERMVDIYRKVIEKYGK